MSGKTKLSRSAKEIFASFDAAPSSVYTQAGIAAILKNYRNVQALALHTKTIDFIEFLEEHGRLKTVEFKSARYDKTITRYVWGNASAFVLAASLGKRGYLSHGTAAVLHGLLDSSSQNLYLNIEQSPKSASSLPSLSQASIDRAFAGKQRESNLTYTYTDVNVTMLAGKNTGNLDVVPLEGDGLTGVRATSIERTLIDIAVRPSYAGGPCSVLEAYVRAKNRISVPRLINVLANLGHVYPYSHSIGFLMQRAGFEKAEYGLLQPLLTEFKFYFGYKMSKPLYDETWQLYHPRELSSL